MKNSYRQWDSNLGPSAYEANSLSYALLVEIFIEHFNVEKRFTWMLDVVKGFVVYHILLTLYTQQTPFKTSQTPKQQNDTNIIW